MRPIDADKLLRDLRGICDVLECQGDPIQALIIMRAVKCVENQEEAVVRCKDCKHMVLEDCGRFCMVWSGYNGCGDNGFCNYGERK